jgi:hypothetical protein
MGIIENRHDEKKKKRKSPPLERNAKGERMKQVSLVVRS